MLYCLWDNDKRKKCQYVFRTDTFFFPKYFWSVVGWICCCRSYGYCTVSLLYIPLQSQTSSCQIIVIWGPSVVGSKSGHMIFKTFDVCYFCAIEEVHTFSLPLKRLLANILHCHYYYYYYFGATGIWTWGGLTIAKQVLYHLSHASRTFCSGYFGYWVSQTICFVLVNYLLIIFAHFSISGCVFFSSSNDNTNTSFSPAICLNFLL
jgi:hypothetical protein